MVLLKKLLFLGVLSLLTLNTQAQANGVQTADTALAIQPQLELGAVVLDEDTLFFISANSGQFSASERATMINRRLLLLAKQKTFNPDSLWVDTVDGVHIVYASNRLLDVFASDCDTAHSPFTQANFLKQQITTAVLAYREGVDLKEILIQIGLAVLTLLIAGFVIRYINRLFKFFGLRIERLRQLFADGFKIKNYQLLGTDDVIRLLLILLNVFRIIFLLFIFYITLPILLRIFPWTQGIADMMFGFILTPAKSIFQAFVAFIPNLFTIGIIYFIFHYVTQGVRYLANEIRTEKLKINGFYPDWAVPTSRILNFLLYAFMLVLIWPYIPGSDSAVFQGVSVFLGLLVSLGSSSAISNIVAGLVITYMRPYRPGDRVRVGEVSGDVVEKNLLVTRLKTIKNEIITVPNSNILSNSSINYSQSSENSEGLVIHTTITIGYDVPWRKVHQMLIEAALKTPMVEEIPKPFVLQTALNDFYVAYEINAYTKSPGKQAVIYSDLHALIQDIFAKNDVEIMSPHYRAEREGPSTIPPVNGASKSEE